MITPWEVVGSKTIASSYGRQFRKTVFINPVTGLAEEFSSFGGPDWAVILALTPKKEVVTGLEYKQGCQKVVRELVGGGIETQEGPLDAVKRELLEETGYQCQEIIPLDPAMWIAPRDSWTRFYLFLGLGAKQVQKKEKAPSEQIETELVPWEKWLEMAHHELENPATVIATFRALPHLK